MQVTSTISVLSSAHLHFARRQKSASYSVTMSTSLLHMRLKPAAE